MTDLLPAYLPHDRRSMLAEGRALPELPSGAVLVISLADALPVAEPFTQGAALHRSHEPLTHQINQLLAALIALAEQWHGSVIAFSSDAMTVWFDAVDGPAVPRAAACARAMQDITGPVVLRTVGDGSARLVLRLAIACGIVRRLVLGDPAFQLFDILAGSTFTRAVGLVWQAQPGEVLVDHAASQALGGVARLERRRNAPDNTEVLALLDAGPAPPTQPWPQLPAGYLPLDVLRPWLLSGLVERIRGGPDLFLTTLRSAVPMWVRWDGLDNDAEQGTQLDGLIHAVQRVVAHYEGAVLQVAPDGHGWRLYAVFGALIAHEDDPRRAVLAALEIQAQATQQGGVLPQIGMSRGTLRMGVLGSASRQTYVANGDGADLAALIMLRAAPGETLIDGMVLRAVRAVVGIDAQVPLQIPGRREALPVFAVRTPLRRRPIRLEEPDYALPLIGRSTELARISALLDTVLSGQGQILVVVAAAGMGKSRLIAEVIRLARLRGLTGYGGACQSTGTNSPYLVWQPIWQACFNIDPDTPVRRQLRTLERNATALVPDCAEILPLLGPLLGLSIPETPVTSALEPKDRQGALHHLLRSCLVAVAHEAAEAGSGLLLVLDDLHWIDVASYALLLELARTITDLPVLIVLATRLLEEGGLAGMPSPALPHCHTIRLDGLDAPSTEVLVQAKLAQLFPAKGAAIPAELLVAVAQRTNGCPFYIEELLNYLHDRGIDPREQIALATLDWPDSLHSLILSRVDRLGASQQAILKAASVIGRRFPVGWLEGAYAHLLPTTDLRAELPALAATDLILQDTTQPELVYLFKHVVTQEVSYNSLGADTRALLHEALGDFLETLAATAPEPYLDALAYHYDRSNNLPKRRHYLRRAAEVAVARFANAAALSYVERALALVPPSDLLERSDLLILRARVFSVLGRMEELASDLDTLDALLAGWADDGRKAIAAFLRAEAATRTGRGPAAMQATYHGLAAVQRFESTAPDAAQFPVAIFATLHTLWYQALSWLLFWMGQQGQHDAAQTLAEQQHSYAVQTNNQLLLAHVSYGMLSIAIHRQQYLRARWLFRQTLKLFRALGDRHAEAMTLAYVGTYPGAIFEASELRLVNARALELYRSFGDHWGEAWVQANIAAELLTQGDGAAARRMLEQSIAPLQNLGDLYAVSVLTVALGGLLHQAGCYAQAHNAYTHALDLARSLGQHWLEIGPHGSLARLYADQGDDTAAWEHAQQALAMARSLGVNEEQARVLLMLGGFHLRRGELAEAERAYRAALECYSAMEPVPLVRVWRSEAQAELAQLALIAGRTAEAQRRVEPVLALLRPWGLSRANEPFRLAYICVGVLEAVGDPRAPELLEVVETELQRCAALFWDGATRKSFLNRTAMFRRLRVE